MAAKSRSGRAPVTLRTIADSLGVSVTTVARALGRGDRLSPGTVHRVREAARELGYVRNLDGVKLRTGQTFVIMAFLGHSDEEEVGDSGSVGLLNGLHLHLAGTDYALRAVPVRLGESALDQIAAVVRGRNCDGLILDHTEPQDARVRYLLEQDVPFVTFGRTELYSEHAWFDVDNEFAALQGTRALIAEGHRRIALVDADPRFLFVRQRLRGYRAALAEAGIAPDEALVRHVDLRADAARAAARDLAAAGADGFVCVNELVFLGARAGVRDALAGADGQIGYSLRAGTNLAAYVGTRVHACHFSRLAAGKALAELLLRRIEGAPAGACQRIARTELRISNG